MTNKIRILIPDDLHINKKNFSSFFGFLERKKIDYKFVKDRRDWIALYGDYTSKASCLDSKIRILQILSDEQLYSYSINGINLFKVARAEALSKVVTEEKWYSVDFPTSSKEVFLKLINNNKFILLNCLAAAWDWINFWHLLLKDEQNFSHCCIFSGSLIYQRSLIETLRHTSTRVFLMEAFLTGNDYYCEEKYEPIANNCNIRFKTVYDSLLKELSVKEFERERIKAINKLLMANNKNVTQPDVGEKIEFHSKNKTILIIGQVVNDFSLLEYNGLGLSSIAFYKKLIYHLLSTGFNVVFKAHPWEEKKTNIESPFTFEKIKNFINEQKEDFKENFFIVDHYPIEKLFNQVDFVIGLNSQSMIEAAFHGLKPVCFGKPFYGDKGFSYDFDLNQIDLLINKLTSDSISGTLTLKEYQSFEIFLTKILQGQLFSIHNSGISKLERTFEISNTISLVKRKKPNVTKSLVVLDERKLSVMDGSDLKEDNEKKVILVPTNEQPLTSFDRKLRKLKTSPRRFFSDSKNPFLRTLRYLFKG